MLCPTSWWRSCFISFLLTRKACNFLLNNRLWCVVTHDNAWSQEDKHHTSLFKYNTNLLGCSGFVHLIKRVNIVLSVQFQANAIIWKKTPQNTEKHTNEHPLTHTKLFSCYPGLNWVIAFIFLSSCLVWVSCTFGPKALQYALICLYVKISTASFSIVLMPQRSRVYFPLPSLHTMNVKYWRGRFKVKQAAPKKWKLVSFSTSQLSVWLKNKSSKNQQYLES